MTCQGQCTGRGSSGDVREEVGRKQSSVVVLTFEQTARPSNPSEAIHSFTNPINPPLLLPLLRDHLNLTSCSLRKLQMCVLTRNLPGRELTAELDAVHVAHLQLAASPREATPDVLHALKTTTTGHVRNKGAVSASWLHGHSWSSRVRETSVCFFPASLLSPPQQLFTLVNSNPEIGSMCY